MEAFEKDDAFMLCQRSHVTNSANMVDNIVEQMF